MINNAKNFWMNLEGVFKEWVIKHFLIIMLICATILSFATRVINLNFVSIDMEQSLLDWYKTMVENNRIYGLYHQIGDYNIPYQAIIMLMTYIPINPVWQFKLVSIIFDYILAMISALLCYTLIDEKWAKKQKLYLSSMVYMIFLFIPSVIIDSSIWGQCDVIYTTFVLASILFLKLDKNVCSFILLGVAFAFKMQALFIVPFYVIYIFCGKNRKISILHFLLVPLTDWIICLPVMIKRNNLLETFQIYFGQVDEYKEMYLNFPSFWQFVGDYYDTLKGIAIITTIMLLGIAFFVIVNSGLDVNSNELFIAGICWTVWTVVEFLPAMHERYGYLLIPLTLILCFVNKSYIIPTVILQYVYICLYADYVFWNGCNYYVMSLLHFIGYLLMTWLFLKNIITKKNESSFFEP